MRRLLVFVALAASLLLPSAVGAQGETIINELKVRLWPEYDRPDLLVIYDFTLAPGTTTPATIKIRVPTDADVTALAQQTQNGLFDVAFKTGVEGDWQTVTFDVAQTPYRLEYYIPIQKKDSTRQFNFVWPGDYAVNTLVVEAQEPPGTTGFTTSPLLPNVESTAEGLSTHSGTFSSLKKDEHWQLQADYSRTTDDLTVTGQPVQPSGGAIEDNASVSAAVVDFLSHNYLLIIAVFGALLIIAGLVWYWQSNASTQPGTGRKRHASRTEDDSDDGQIYCPQCGKRAQPVDKFCRACGTRLRREEV
jgi:hypothetical protein